MKSHDEIKMETVHEGKGLPLMFLLLILFVAGLTFALVGF